MAVTVTVTPSSASANSYTSVADANTYLTARLNITAWEDADPDDQARAVIGATTWLDLEGYRGEKATSGQALKWPRISCPDEDGYDYDTGVIPAFLKHATAELALYLLNQATTDPFQPTGLEGFEAVKVGPLEVTPANQTQKASELPESVRRMIAHTLTTTRGSGRTWRA